MREIRGIYMHGMGTVKGKDEKYFVPGEEHANL
jgi:hypothetical protein